jgi:hypothetical protein
MLQKNTVGSKILHLVRGHRRRSGKIDISHILFFLTKSNWVPSSLPHP